jgi:DNA-binding HxlR family transcriptional regulator
VKTYKQYCALARGLDLVGDRWTLLIVRELLSLGECRYGDLRRGLPGIATNLLADRLRDMEEAGLLQRSRLQRPANAVVISLTDRGAALEGVVREFIKWGAPLMNPPMPDESFRAHWLLLPLRALCRDNAPEARRQVVRVGTLEDGCDIIVDAGVVRVTAGVSREHPDAVVAGDPGSLVALFAGQMPVSTAASAQLITGDIDAVARIVGGIPTAAAGLAS